MLEANHRKRLECIRDAGSYPVERNAAGAALAEIDRQADVIMKLEEDLAAITAGLAVQSPYAIEPRIYRVETLVNRHVRKLESHAERLDFLTTILEHIKDSFRAESTQTETKT